jgi:hypothetical protein
MTGVTKALATTAVLLALAGSALAEGNDRQETITGPNFVGCQDYAMYRRLTAAASANDVDAFSSLLEAGLRAGQCIEWREGQRVRREQGGFFFSGLVAWGEAGPCFWTTNRATTSR